MKLKTTIIKAATVREAMKKVKNPAGQEELDYVLAHPDEFPDLKDGNFHFFFGAAGGVSAPSLYWDGGRFRRDLGWLGSDWGSDDRAVLRNSDVEIESGSDLTFASLILDLEKIIEKYKKV